MYRVKGSIENQRERNHEIHLGQCRKDGREQGLPNARRGAG
jgi:hypothetical protein